MTLLIASGNAHKVAEVRSLLGPEVCCLSWKDLPGRLEVIENAGTFAGNATKKAVESAAWLGQLAAADKPSTGLQLPHYVLADDSGL